MKTMLLTTAAVLAAATLATASVQAQDGSGRPGWRAERGEMMRAHDRGAGATASTTAAGIMAAT